MSTHGTGDVVDIRMLRLKDEQDGLATLVSEMWTGHVNSQSRRKWLSEVAEVREFLYATDTTTTSNRTNAHDHSMNRPKLMQIADALEAHYMDALFPHDQWQQFIPMDEQAAKPMTKNLIESYIRNRHRMYNRRQQDQLAIRDWIETGCAIEETVYTSAMAEQLEDGTARRAYTGPQVRRIDPRRVAYNPDASSWEDSWKIVQSIWTPGDIIKMINDEELSEEYRDVLTKSLHLHNHVRTHWGEFDEEWLHGTYTGWDNNLSYWGQSNTIEILTFYGDLYDSDKDEFRKAQKIVVVDRKWVLLDEALDTWDGKPMLRRSTWRERPNSLIPMSPLANLTGIQYHINHLQNSRADAFDLMIRPDRLIAGVEDIKQAPDGTNHYWSHDGNAIVRNISPDTTVLNADMQIEILERRMEEYAGVPPEAMGMKTPGEQTKFEVAERLNSATRLFNSKTRRFETELVAPTLGDELELAKVHLDQNLRIMVSSDEGDIFETITPDLLKNRGALIPVGAKHFAQQQRLTQDLQGIMQMLAVDPAVAVHFPPKRLARALSLQLGNFGEVDGIFEEYGRLDESVEASQRQQAAAAVIDQSAAAQQQLADPTGSADLPI